MKLTLVKCRICDYWHNPTAHANHCPVCGAETIRAMGRYYSIVMHDTKVIPIARAVPRDYAFGRSYVA